MTEIVSKPDHGNKIVDAQGIAMGDFQRYMDDITLLLNANLLGAQVTLPSYTVAKLPTVTAAPGYIFVSDEAGGPVPAFSDGVNWRRCTDRNIVSS